MAKMNANHGSELHLLRYMGRHRCQWDSAVLQSLARTEDQSVKQLCWFDFPFDDRAAPWDAEWKSVDFLPSHGGTAWTDFWPDRSPGDPKRTGVPSWDAIGQITTVHGQEWLLVEAKAHIGELSNPAAACRAGGKNRETIERTLRQTFESLSGTRPWNEVSAAWLGSHYQKANRLACLHFLNREKPNARLLYVFFIGDTFSDSPQTKEEWDSAIEQEYQALGLVRNRIPAIHELVLHVSGWQGL